MPRIKIITCPLCKGKLEVDMNSGKVYRHFAKMKGDEAVDAFDRVVGKVAEKEGSGEEIFQQAAERAKDKDLDALFKKATEKAKEDLEEED
ncbi:MAG: hypothetical protein ACYTHM_06165 [Planctomycetota bacterium]|jgi:phage shock protein A